VLVLISPLICNTILIGVTQILLFKISHLPFISPSAGIANFVLYQIRTAVTKPVTVTFRIFSILNIFTTEMALMVVFFISHELYILPIRIRYRGFVP
jgi:hypothetical protein